MLWSMKKWTHKQTATCGYVDPDTQEVCGAGLVLFSMEDDPEDKWTHGSGNSQEVLLHKPVPTW